MANEVVNRRLNVYIDAAGAEEALSRLTKKEAELVKAIDKAKAAGKDFTKEMQQLGNTRQQISNLEGVISGKMLPSVRQAEAAVSKLRRELRQLPSDSQAAANKLQEFRKAEATLKAVKDQAYGAGRALDGIAKDRGLKAVFDNDFGFFLGGGLLDAVNSIAAGAERFFADAVDNALEAEKATARLKGTLDNLGRADVFERLSNSADELAESFGYLDNDDILGVFEQLITYGKLTEQQINDLTPVIIDFAAKSQIEISEATSVIIKALEGNGKALKEYGIEVTGAKDETEALGIIMDQLGPKVEGAAAAFGETTSGQIAKTRQEIENLKEDIGVGLLPVVKEFYSFISGALTGVREFINAIKIAGDTTKFSVMDRIKLFMGDPEVTARVAAERVRQMAAEQREINAAGTPTNDVIGLGAGESPEERQKREAEAKRKADQRKKELDELKKKYQEFAQAIRNEKIDTTFGEIFAAFRKINDEAEKDLEKLAEFQKKGLVTPAEFEELSSAVEAILEAQRIKLQEKYGLNPVKIAIEPVFDPRQADADIANTKVPSDPLATLTRQLGIQDREATAKLQLDIMQSAGAKRLALQKQQLDEERDQELSNKELTESEKAVIEQEYRDKKLQLEREFWMGIADIVLEFAGQISSILLNISQVRQNNEQAELDREIENNEKRKASAKKLLDSKSITQKEYDRRVAKIEADQEKRQAEFARRQFERDKNAQTVQALISGAQAVLSTISRFGPPIPPNFLGIAAMGLTLATSAAQVAAIRSAKPPKFEEGGILPQGSSHRQGGISLIDNRTGANLGEIEGGEPIISKKVYARNKPLIDSLLNPAWKNAPVMAMNIPNLNRSMQRHFADGGILPDPGSVPGNEEMMTLLRSLNQRLNEPIISYTVYGDYELKANKINAIRNAGVMR